MCKMFSVLAWIALVAVVVCADVDTESHENTESHKNRYKRQIPGLGGESCLQIYSVPKRSVVCDPSPEVKNELASLTESLDEQKASISQLQTTVDNINPDKPKELPEEIKERLNTIDGIKLTQAGHTEYLKRLETELGHLLERMQRIESSDRHELARLIELQTRLIQVTLHQSNVSLHDDYIDKLADSTNDLTHKLQQLELDLNVNIHQSETQLEKQVQQNDQQNHDRVNQLHDNIKEQIDNIQASLDSEAGHRRHYQNQTESNQKDVTKLLEALTSLRENQAQAMVREDQLQNKVYELRNKLGNLLEEKTQHQKYSDHMRSSVDVLLDKQTNLEKHLNTCANRTYQLQEEMREIRKVVDDRKHLLPRTLRGKHLNHFKVQTITQLY